jgi:cysteinyl-tRNA synthetase
VFFARFNVALKPNNLHVYNTLSRSKERFKPLAPPFVGMYVCGPTVYGDAHIGHAKSYVSFDVIVRYLRHLGYNVRYVQNITDVGHLTDDADQGEDKVERKARAEQVHPMQIAEKFTRSYFEDMDRLNLLRPDISPRASGHIIEQIELVKRIIAAGHAYEVGGNVYFDVASWPKYGKLSGRNVEEMQAGARVEVAAEKRHSADFALWKRADPGHIMQWPSPWGMGYPGWHLECSAMSMKYLGESFDIHGGGLENQFPHHEDEIAQAEAATGKPFVKYWLHNNMVTVGGQKMGKSLGNFITLKDAFQKWDPMVLRLFILQSHYRSPTDFSEEALLAAQAGYDRLSGAVFRLMTDAINAPKGQVEQGVAEKVEATRLRFLRAMDDDFSTPIALAALFDFARELNTIASKHDLTRGSYDLALNAFSEMAWHVMGLNLGTGVIALGQKLVTDMHAESQEVARHNLERFHAMAEYLVDLRKEARKSGNFAQADGIRKFLDEMGIVLEDTREGSRWRFKRKVDHV